MRLILLWAVPLAGAAAAYAMPGSKAARFRVALLVTVALFHSGLVLSLWIQPAPFSLAGWIGIDGLGQLVLTVTSILFAATAFHSIGYLRHEMVNEARIFVTGLLTFLAAASIVSISQHLALLWVGMEATTLGLAPLVFQRANRRSLEAVWKYLLISSVGIALALLGVFFLATAQHGVAGHPLILRDLVANASQLNEAWLRAAFIFLLVGFGTKMGLAPMHTWKPDTYGEAPGVVAGLMAGALTSCAFLGLARATEVMMAAGLQDFVQPLLIGFGLLSLAVAAAFIVGQSDLRRLLAYSSIEHMGLLVLGLGIGGVASYGSALHMVNNGLAKGWMFLIAGNIVIATGTSAAAENRGLVRSLPWSGSLLVLGLFAVTGSPPFGLFVSEFSILRGAVTTGHPWVAAATLALLAMIFVGMSSMILEMALGAPARVTPEVPEDRRLLLSPLVLAAAVLTLGLYIPPGMRSMLEQAARALGGVGP